MTLQDAVGLAADFDTWNHPKKILFLGWFLHVHEGKERFNPVDVRLCYELVNLQKPSSIGPFLKSLTQSNPKRLLRDSNGFYLPKHLREEFQSQYGDRAITVQVHDLLLQLPLKIPSMSERVFLEEALTCFRHKAFRAAIVMTWNLAFAHVRDVVLTRHLPAFNLQFPKAHPKKRLSAGVVTVDDFNEFKESEFLEVCRGANIIDGNAYKILDEKLGRRNTAAHPSTVVVSQLQAEEFISDLITNVVLRFV